MEHVHEHTSKTFERELDSLENLIAKMGGLAEAQLAEALQALASRDADRSTQVVRNDQRIDLLQAEIDHQTIRILALRHPVADDLRSVLTAIKVAAALERIGDYATNIAKRTLAISQVPMAGLNTGTIVRMGEMVHNMVTSVVDAYLSGDAAKAGDVRAHDEEVDRMNTSLFRELLTYMMEDSRAITPCTHLLFVAKNLERIGDYATLIAEQVHFLVLGAPPTRERVKRDEACFTVVSPREAGAT